MSLRRMVTESGTGYELKGKPSSSLSAVATVFGNTCDL